MNIEKLSEKIGDFGKDIRLNLQSVSTQEGSPGLTKEQLSGIALACAYSIGNPEILEAIKEEFQPNENLISAAKSAATIMRMNNIYYRFLHLCDDKEFSKMPVRLRMNVIAKPPVEKVDFELMSLAVSALSGCGMCINSHIQEVKKAGVSNEGIQSAVRLASVLSATKAALVINNI